MKKRILAFALLMVCAVVAMAQERVISGTLIDKETKEPVMQTTIQLLKASDSTYVAGAVSNEDGEFTVTAPENGKYIVKMTNVGYKQITRNLTITEDKNFAFGKVNMETDAVLLREVVANGVAAKVIVKEDTFIYNAAAYHTPEGSVIEELVKRLPGAQIDDDGKITINGKEVKKIKVDGKEFMTGDTQTALKNLPTAIVEKVKAYDEKSDLARMTGIDDGEESTVLDFGIKRGMNKGYMANIDLAYGTKDRYAERIMGAWMKDDQRLMIFGNMNNNNDRGFTSGGRGGGRGGNGQTENKMFGANYNYEKRNKLNIDLSLRWNHSNSDNWNKSASENFIRRPSVFTNSTSQSYGRNNSWNFSGRVEWKPDTLTTIAIRPNLTTSSSDSRSLSANGTFASDPLLAIEQYTGAQDIDPLMDTEFMTDLNNLIYKQSLGADSILTNRRENSSISYSRNLNFNVQATVSRRLSSTGRNLTVQGRYSTGDSDSDNLSQQFVQLFRPYLTGELVMNDHDSLYFRNRYNVTPSNNQTYQVSATYSEPIATATFLQLRYQYQFRHTYNNRQTHDFSKFPELYPNGLNAADFGAGLKPSFRNFQPYLTPFVTEQYPLEYYLDKDQSRLSEYNNYIHEVELTLRRTTNKYNLNAGVMLQPQSSNLHYEFKGVRDVTRHVTNITPTLDFRYRWTKQKSIRLNYRGSTSQPSMTDLMDITDDSNPLNISKGNANLKPSFSSNFRMQYNNYVQTHMRTVMANLTFGFTNNNVANKVTYFDKETIYDGIKFIAGSRLTQPENINGNWNANGAFMFNTALDSIGRWNVNSFTSISFNNRASYVTLQKLDAFGNRMYRMNDGTIVAVNTDNQIVDLDNQIIGKYNKKGSTVYDEATKNYTRSTSLSERIGGSYRTEWLEVELNGNVTYNINRNALQPNANNDTWHFSYGTDITINLPWSMSIATGAHMESRRGYQDAAANTNEFIWNAQISQSFLSKKNLTLSAQFNDILNRRSNFTRNISANSRTDTWYNSINSYCMFHVIYRFNAFGGKAARQMERSVNISEGATPPREGGNRDGNRGGGGSRGGNRGSFGGGGFGGGRF